MSKIVFVVGAGASKDFGLPLGSELAADVRDIVQSEINHPPDMFRSVIGSAMQSNISGNYAEAARDLCGGLVTARSVDRLLDSRKDRPLVVEIGKCGIARAIAQRETATSMGSMSNDHDWNTVQYAMLNSNQTWLARLFSILHEGVSPSNANSIFQSCSFVTFNYDRCIERYLELAFQHILNLSYDETIEIVSSIPIFHVYGSLGALPRKNQFGIPFGPAPDRIRESSSNIRTFTEGASEEALDNIRAHLSDATLVVFLGFAFDPVNVAALFDKHLQPEQEICGTGIGLSQADRNRIESTIAPHVRGLIDRLPTQNCHDFIASHWFSELVERFLFS